LGKVGGTLEIGQEPVGNIGSGGCAPVFEIRGQTQHANLARRKGATAKITLESSELVTPIEITDSNAQQFQVWSGTFMNGVEGKEGFIIDWRSGVVAAPAGLHQYKVAFYTRCDGFACHTTEPSLTYVVYYAYDPSAQQGVVSVSITRAHVARLLEGIYSGFLLPASFGGLNASLYG
jgi:hypothetical protein